MYQKDLNMSYLLDFYGDAIPPKHKEILSQYYEEDLSLSEVAENFGISRQGARHLIKKGEEQLIFLEEKLGLAKRYKDTNRLYSDLIFRLDELEREINGDFDREKITEIFSCVKATALEIDFD